MLQEVAPHHKFGLEAYLTWEGKIQIKSPQQELRISFDDHNTLFYLYRTRVRSLAMLVTHSLTD